MRISDWSSDVCSSDLAGGAVRLAVQRGAGELRLDQIGAAQLGPGQRRAGQYRAVELGVIEVGLVQLGAGPIGLGQRGAADRTRVVEGKRVSVRGALGGRLIITKKNTVTTTEEQ